MKKIIITTLVLNCLLFSTGTAFDSTANEVVTDAGKEKKESTIQTQGIIPAMDGKEDNAQNRFAKKVKDGTLELMDLPLVIVYWIDLTSPDSERVRT